MLFESATINEYLDDVGPGRSLNPQESLRRAHNRTWIELISTLLVMRNRLQNLQTEQESRELAGCINRERQHLESRLGQGPFFNGKEFSLLDAAVVPLFQRLHWLLELVPDPGVTRRRAETPGLA